jgi:glycosyltransferase involved in cell wall biosynthesis
MKILLSAYSCLPTDGSEPGIGWNWARALASNGHDVVVITRSVNQQRIETYLRNHPLPMRFVYHDLPAPWPALYKLPVGNYAFYRLWQSSAAKAALELHRSERFDRVQHITWGSFRVPSQMGRLGIPFTFGPVGGGEDTPPQLRSGLGWRGRLWDVLRRLSGAAMAPWMGSTYAAATEIIATTSETLNAIPARYRHKTRVQQAVGIEPGQIRGEDDSVARHMRQSSRLELLFVGRLLPWKGLHLVLKALAALNADGARVHLTVIGRGSDRPRLERLARRLKLESSITWVDWMPREELMRQYARFDLFTFPSLHDSGGMAVLEAMSFGLPVLCLDLGGPAMAADGSCGRVVAARSASEERVVAEIAAFLAEMMADREALERLSRGARARAASLTWQANVDAVYREPAERPAHSIEGVFCAEA